MICTKPTYKVDFTKKILYTNGCSYTLGEELENPERDAWPYKLANLMGICQDNVINEGYGGASIQFITMGTILFCERYLKDGYDLTNLLVILQFPDFHRQLKCFHGNNFVQDFTTIYNVGLSFIEDINKVRTYNVILEKGKYQDDLDFNNFSKSFFNYQTSALFYLCHHAYKFIYKIEQILMLHNYLKAKGIKHFFLEALEIYNKDFYYEHYYLGERFLKKEYKFFLKLINGQLNRKLDDFYFCEDNMEHWCKSNNYPFGPREHPLEEGHKAWAEYIFKKIGDRF